MSVARVFAERGEAAFRAEETRQLAACAALPGAASSPPAAARSLQPGNRELIRRARRLGVPGRAVGRGAAPPARQARRAAAVRLPRAGARAVHGAAAATTASPTSRSGPRRARTRRRSPGALALALREVRHEVPDHLRHPRQPGGVPRGARPRRPQAAGRRAVPRRRGRLRGRAEPGHRAPAGDGQQGDLGARQPRPRRARPRGRARCSSTRTPAGPRCGPPRC